jgi:arylsulfatase A-like enzyme
MESNKAASHDNMAEAIPIRNRPNIILIVMDALSANNMGVYGYKRSSTPFIEKWAKDAIIFTNAYSCSNWTTPAVMSLLTGQRPSSHRVWHRVYNHPIDDYRKSLPYILRNNGYMNYAFVQNKYAHPRTLGMEKYYLINDKADTFWLKGRWWVFGVLEKLPIKSPVVRDWILGNNMIVDQIYYFRPAIKQYSTREPPKLVYERFLNNMTGRTDIASAPFFAYLHLLPPHDPYLPPGPFRGIYGDDDKLISREDQQKYLNRAYLPQEQEDIDILQKRYDEFVAYSDAEFEKFIGDLAATVNLSKTIVILSADHGESFAHNHQGHDGPHLYESLIHIPLIIKLPGEKRGKVIDMPVEQIDIAPTILELADIAVPEWIDGRSVAPLIKGEKQDLRPIISMQLIKNSIFSDKITNGTIAIYDGQYKLIYYIEKNIRRLFNISKDPEELNDVMDEKSLVAEKLMRFISNNVPGIAYEN